jgi:acyl-CoA thioester hydrolase
MKIIDVYEYRVKITKNEIDFNNHLNNFYYVKWMQDSGMAHSKANGVTLETYKKIGATWFAKSHFIEYKSPAFLGDEITIKTWISEIRKIKSTRKYEFYRTKDNKLLATAETLWVFIDLKSGRPTLIKEAIKNSFIAVKNKS